LFAISHEALSGRESMTRSKLLQCAIVSVLAAATLSAFADGNPSNQTLNVQGILRTMANDFQTSAVGLDVSLYASQTDKTPFFTQHFQTVQVDNGFFSIELSGMNLSFNTADAWVGIYVIGDGMEMPRQHLTAVPFAFNAANATNAVNATNATNATSASRADSLSSTCSGCVGVSMLAPVATTAGASTFTHAGWDIDPAKGTASNQLLTVTPPGPGYLHIQVIAHLDVPAPAQCVVVSLSKGSGADPTTATSSQTICAPQGGTDTLVREFFTSGADFAVADSTPQPIFINAKFETNPAAHSTLFDVTTQVLFYANQLKIGP
jgi:hypothetical protein